MPAAVTAFISGAVPAVALWVPFNVTVRDKVPGAVKLADASAYYPQAAIIGGWAAANDYYEPNKETLGKLIKGWAEANDYIIANSGEAMEKLQKAPLQPDAAGDINESFKAQKMFTSSEWKKLLFGRHRHQLAAADHRLLHGQCRRQGFHARQQIFRSEPLSEDDCIAQALANGGLRSPFATHPVPAWP